MEHERFVIEFNGEEIEEIYLDLFSLEVELDDELAGLFKLKIALLLQADGKWTYIDDDRLLIWNSVVVKAGFSGGLEELIRGYITHVKPYFDPDPTQCYLEIWGMDESVLLDREEKLIAWPNKKDSDIVAEILSLYGFDAMLEDTQVIHDEAISTIIQRETDMQFLKRLALRNGFECFIEGKTGYFRKPQLDDPPQPLLAAHFGDKTTLDRFSIEVNALTPVNVAMSQIDRMNKDILATSVNSSQQTRLGGTDAQTLLAAGMNPGQVHMRMTVATGTLEMQALCQGLFHQGEWWITAEGEVAGNRYAQVLKPRKTVTIKGVGETYSGLYYVTHVTHTFTGDGYSQSFRAKRNALRPSGSEDFAEETGGFF